MPSGRLRMKCRVAAALVQQLRGGRIHGNVDRVLLPEGEPPIEPRRVRLGRLRVDLSGLHEVYDRLGDRTSRDLLLRLAAFRTLGHWRVELPPGRAQRADLIRTAYSDLRVATDVRSLGIPGIFADRWDLEPLGLPVVLDAHVLNIQHTFQLDQYRPRIAEPWLKHSDRVIDGGACWGDASLLFAHTVGDTGRVLSYEIDPANVALLRENLAHNPGLAPRIVLEERGLWDVPDVTLGVRPMGPASSIRTAVDGASVRSATIDDAVARGLLDRVDAIKLDIEGSELPALRGARVSLERFRPRLAIAAYHRHDDLRDLTRFLSDLGLGYRFAIRHHSLHLEETILYAWTDHP